jgi:4-methyl-5(b-hydroxyethyl)-thiazole monophosphate biosynthesis
MFNLTTRLLSTQAAVRTIRCRVLVPFATGSEDIELSAITDTLRRADVDVTLASIETNVTSITLSRGLSIIPDVKGLNTLVNTSFDAIVLPGGVVGAKTLSSDSSLLHLLKNNRGILGAICASPAIVLAHHGLLSGKTNVTCYPSFKDKLPVKISNDSVTVDGKLITSRGPATAILFSLQLVAALRGFDVAEKVGTDMLVEQVELDKIKSRMM